MTKKTDIKAEATTSVAVIEKRLIGQPGVIAVGGVILEPVIQIPKVNGPIYHNGILLVDYSYARIGDKSAKLSIYLYTLKPVGDVLPIDMFIVADELSSLDLYTPGYLDFQDESFTVITLVNSKSKNDYFRGGVVLVNVETEDNSFQDSVIELQSRHYGIIRGGEQKNPALNRITLVDVDTYKLRLQGHQLPPGNYRDSDLYENTFVRGEKDDDRSITIWNSNLRHNSFREGKISIHASTISMSGFLFTGDVRLDDVTINNEYFTQVPGVYLTSKFDLTLIDVAGSAPARMVRVDQDNVMITLPPEKDMFRIGETHHKLLTMSFRNPHSRRSLRNKTFELLFGDNMPSEMEESVLDYFIDTVLSRCAMMNLVDSAKRLLAGNLVGVKARRASPLPVPGLPAFLSPGRMSELDVANGQFGGVNRSVVEQLRNNTVTDYGTSSSLANEYDKTIYIDSVGKF